jgi:hypothetical protein
VKLVPTADAYRSGWYTHLGGTENLHQELVSGDDTYIQSDPETTGASVVFRLSGEGDPGDGCYFRYRYGKNQDDEQSINLFISIHQGGEFPNMPGYIVADWFHEYISSEWTTVEQMLSEAQIEKITDFDDLFVQIQTFEI